MGLHLNELTKVDFSEHPFADFTQTKPTDIEITAEGLDCLPDFTVEGQFSMRNYCWALLQKATKLPHHLWDAFLIRQCDQVQKPFVWLQRFELLLMLNEALLSKMGQQTATQFALGAIERARRCIWQGVSKELEGSIAEFYNLRYNIQEVKEKLKHLPDFAEKLTYLLEAKTSYLQNKPGFTASNLIPFDIQIDLEIEKLRQLETLFSTVSMQPSSMNEEAVLPKIKINFTVAELAYFFRAMYDLDLIPRQFKTEVCKFLAAHFQTKQSEDISWRSIKNHFDSPTSKAMENCYEHFVHLMQKAKKDRGK
ncbi:MAG: hypothetical protein GC192_16580 [Bacteroidetes bacterium]|nr:hypothetical protein [Bacteroidota bacterium]